jgi:hypothetical protein
MGITERTKQGCSRRNFLITAAVLGGGAVLARKGYEVLELLHQFEVHNNVSRWPLVIQQQIRTNYDNIMYITEGSQDILVSTLYFQLQGKSASENGVKVMRVLYGKDGTAIDGWPEFIPVESIIELGEKSSQIFLSQIDAIYFPVPKPGK